MGAGAWELPCDQEGSGGGVPPNWGMGAQTPAGVCPVDIVEYRIIRNRIIM